VTGCAGFIGSHFTEECLARGDIVFGVDSLTYAGKLENMNQFISDIIFYNFDICETDRVKNIVEENDIQWIINFAAESHVDNSIKSCDSFIRSNIIGVKSLLDICRETSCKLLQISTDEVYGTIRKGSFKETDILNPRNPYSATKASAEHMINSYHHTHGVNFKTVRMSNNFGPRQDDEKFLPTIIRNLKNLEKIPVYGDGLNIRDWLYVKDSCNLVYEILIKGKINNVYNLTLCNEMTNLDIIRSVTDILDLKFKESIVFVKDRPGHDFRYSISNDKMCGLGINLYSEFKLNLKSTIDRFQ
jgi:dTDP-glucose 4,6-dehydratase